MQKATFLIGNNDYIHRRQFTMNRDTTFITLFDTQESSDAPANDTVKVPDP